MANRTHYKPKRGRLSEPVKTTVTKQQLAQIQDAAYRSDMTVSAWVRGIVLRAAQRQAG